MISNKYSNWILLLFTIVSLTLSVEINTDNVHLTESGLGEEINCTKYSSCTQCADVPVCGWMIEKQICRIYSNHSLLENSIVLTKEFCTEYTVSLTTIDTHHWIKVVVSNIDVKSVHNFLNEHAVISFDVENKLYNASINNGVIACKLVKADGFNDKRRKSFKINPLHIFYFSIIVNGVRLKFNDPRDHYISYHNWSCPNAICSIVYWESDSRKYYCKWCLENDDCRIAAKQRDSCDVRNAINNMKMVRETAPSLFDVNSPDLAIESVEPDMLLFTRNTSSILNIIIKNHRFLSDDKSTKVTVSGQDCYNVTTVDDRTIKCIVSYFNNPTLSVEGPVLVEYAYKTTAVRLRSTQTFKFVVPSVTGVNPMCGPVTGGTRIELTGLYLNVTTNVEVFFKNMSATPMCEIQELSRDRISCETVPVNGSRGHGPDVGPLLIVFDKMKGTYYKKKKFSYVAKPTVLDGQVFAGIASGDVPLVVRGDFECTENQKMYVEYKRTLYFGLCVVRDINGTKAMYCRPPNFDSPAMTTSLSLGFSAEMNGKVLQMQAPSHYLMYHDPVYVDFEVYNQNDTVRVNGLFPDPMHCRRQLDDSYYFDVVLLGLQSPVDDDDDNLTLCSVIEVTDSYMECRPPSGTSLVDVLEIAIVVPDGQVKRTIALVHRQHKQYYQILKSMQKPQCLIGGISALFVCVIAVMFSVKKIRGHSKEYMGRQYINELRNITAGIENTSDYLLQDSNTVRGIKTEQT